MNHRPTIMVVEDDGDIREAVCDLLRGDGFDVVTAENGKEALHKLRENPSAVRAIVLDLVMPVMNGATFRGEQLGDPAIAAIPLIMLTGRDDFAPLANALEVAACIRKPFTDEELLRVVNRYR